MVGTEQGLTDCLQLLNERIVSYGGPNNDGPAQWDAPQKEKGKEKDIS